MLIMQILTTNAGSTSVKLGVFAEDGSERARVGKSRGRGKEHANAADALGGVIDELAQSGTLRVDAVEGFGHRFVASGPLRPEPTAIDDALVAELQRAEPFAPTHMVQSLALLAAARRFIPSATHVAIFDTAFHATMPPRAAG